MMVVGVLALAGCRVMARDVPASAAQGIVARWFPEHRRDFVFEQIPADPDGDVFEIESRAGRIVVRGNDGVSMASGLNWYLKYFGQVNITWSASRTKLPRALPAVPNKIRQVSPYKYRYIFNYCTFSYSLAWMDWPQWERLIDWMALHGINMPLSITGQEAVWREVYRKLGLDDREIGEFFTGAAFLPFGWMGCIDGWGGPLPESWYAQRVALQQKILERERSLGMTPLLQGFTGHVPQSITRLYPDARLHPITWNSFEPTYFLDPHDPRFEKIGAMFIEEQTRLFGTNHLYASDTFIEMKPDTDDPQFLTDFSKAIYHAMTAADPEAIWVMQDWFFAFDEVFNLNYWQPAQTKALLASVPQGKLLMLEMGSYWASKGAFYGQPWIYTYIQNFGGVVSLHGSVEYQAQTIFNVLKHPDRGNLIGLGMTDEGFDYNPLVMDFRTDAMWRAERPDVDRWIADYLLRRYGRKDAAIDNAWKILRKTAHSAWRYDSVVCTLLAGGNGGGPGYDSVEFARSLDLYLQAAGRLGKTDTYRFDLLNIERQVLGNLADKYYRQVKEAIASGDVDALDAAGGRMLALIDDMDRLTGTRRDFMFGPWLEDAQSWGKTTAEKRYYAWNAKNLITLWGPPQTGIYQYAHRQWSGLLKNYYRPRWEKYLAAQRNAVLAGHPLDEKAFAKELREWEDEWGRRDGTFPTRATGDTVRIARELWAKYRPDIFDGSETK